MRAHGSHVRSRAACEPWREHSLGTGQRSNQWVGQKIPEVYADCLGFILHKEKNNTVKQGRPGKAFRGSTWNLWLSVIYFLLTAFVLIVQSFPSEGKRKLAFREQFRYFIVYFGHSFGIRFSEAATVKMSNFILVHSGRSRERPTGDDASWEGAHGVFHTLLS